MYIAPQTHLLILFYAALPANILLSGLNTVIFNGYYGACTTSIYVQVDC